jgi:hypothetical protein
MVRSRLAPFGCGPGSMMRSKARDHIDVERFAQLGERAWSI